MKNRQQPIKRKFGGCSVRLVTDGNFFDVAWDLWARQHYTTRRGKAVDTRVLQWAWRTRQSSKF